MTLTQAPSKNTGVSSPAPSTGPSPASSPAPSTGPSPASSPASSRTFSLDEALGEDLRAIDAAGLRRHLRTITGAQEESVSIDGRELLLFCSNNYLGLAAHPALTAAAAEAASRYGASAVSSRLISGHMSVHEELERRLASWKGVEAALLFSTGYQANIGAIGSLCRRGDVVISDELNHASLIDGARLSRAEIAIYRHNDVAHLRKLLAEHCGRGCRVLVATESVFSMDGDLAPLVEIAEATRAAGAWLMVDEAHGAGIFGPSGAGLVAELGIGEAVDVHMGTLGKALGSFGAYVAGSRVLIDTLINRARSFIFTTGLPPSAAAAANAALDVIAAEPERGHGLRERARELGLRLRCAGLDVPHVDSQILPILIGDARDTVALASRLLERGIYVAAIRPPTVPQRTSRLRLSLMATHSAEQIDRVARALEECVGEGR